MSEFKVWRIVPLSMVTTCAQEPLQKQLEEITRRHDQQVRINKRLIKAWKDAQQPALEQAQKYETCAKEWIEKTEWIQNFDFPAKYLGWHRADVVRDMLEQTQKKIAVLEAENGIFQVMYDSVRESEKKLKAELEAQLLKTRLSEAKTTSPIPSDFELYSAPVFITKLEAQTQDSKEATPAQPIEPASHIGDSNEMVQPTDISKQLREYAADSGYSHNDYADTMLAAASEIERHYDGMLAWKKTAETKDRKLSQEIESRISERCAARLGASQAQQPAQEPVGEVQHYAAPANLPAYVNMKWYGKPPKNGTKLYTAPVKQESKP